MNRLVKTRGWNRQRLPIEQNINRIAFLNFCRRAVFSSRQRCKVTGTPHSITIDDLDRLLVDQRYCCAVSGIELENPVMKPANPFGPSLDRIVPSLGYVPGNIRITCLIVNVAMNRWGEATLRKLIGKMNANVGGVNRRTLKFHLSGSV